jgi:hypothetical protein
MVSCREALCNPFNHRLSDSEDRRPLPTLYNIDRDSYRKAEHMNRRSSTSSSTISRTLPTQHCISFYIIFNAIVYIYRDGLKHQSRIASGGKSFPEKFDITTGLSYLPSFSVLHIQYKAEEVIL